MMAQTPAQKAAAAKQALADKLAMDKAMAARGVARKNAAQKEKTYIESFENPITSQYDPRIAQGGRVNTAGEIVEFNPEMAGTQMTSSGTAPVAGKSFEKLGKLLRYKPGSKAGFQIPVFADGKGGEFDGEEVAISAKPGGNKFVASDGTPFEDEDTYLDYQEMLDEKETAMDIKKREGQSAYDLLYTQFAQYGMGSLVEPLKQFIQQGLSKAEFTLRLRETEAYKKRFAANASRIANGLAAIDEADYISLEDQYQNIMRNYGLPASYYAKGDLGRQEGFEKLIANDVDSIELENRIMTAQQRVMNANPEVLASLKQFYPEIQNGDILAYVLDPKNGKDIINRKVTAAEIGGAATQAGLGLTGTRAEELGAAGVTKAQAQQGFQAVAEVAPRGGQLAAIYGESPYTQQTAEAEVFGLAGSTEAAKQRKKLKSLEEASFSGRSGVAQGALGRERAGNL